MKIKAVVFDSYGTLFDVYSIQILAEQFYPSEVGTSHSFRTMSGLRLKSDKSSIIFVLCHKTRTLARIYSW